MLCHQVEDTSRLLIHEHTVVRKGYVKSNRPEITLVLPWKTSVTSGYLRTFRGLSSLSGKLGMMCSTRWSLTPRLCTWSWATMNRIPITLALTLRRRRGAPELADYLRTQSWRSTTFLHSARTLCVQDILRSPKGRHGDLQAEMAIRHRRGPLPKDLGNEQMIKAQWGSS